ncbi:MAG: phosphate starvation-inducible PhoH-like protein [Gammaproteobacteria bacterium]
MRQAIDVLDDVNDISFNFFTATDVVRHPVVARIVQAYEDYELTQETLLAKKRQEQNNKNNISSNGK